MQLGANSGHNSVKTAWLGKFWFSQNLGKFLEKPIKFVEKNEIFRFFSNLAGWILVGFAIQLRGLTMAFQVGMVISFLVLLFFGGFSFSILELFLSVAFVELVYLFIMLMILVFFLDRIWGLFARLFLEK